MSRNYTRYLWKCDIELDMGDNGKHHITLREPNTAELKELVSVQKKLEGIKDDDVEVVFDALSVFVKLCKTLIVDNDFTDEEGKYSSQDVAELLDGKVAELKDVFFEYMQRVPLLQRNVKQ